MSNVRELSGLTLRFSISALLLAALSTSCGGGAGGSAYELGSGDENPFFNPGNPGSGGQPSTPTAHYNLSLPGYNINPIGGSPVALAAGDFDSDGDMDYAVLDSTPELNVYLNNGDNTMADAVSLTLGDDFDGGTMMSLIVADFNNDGNADIAAGAGGAAQIIDLWLAVGDGTFSDPVEHELGADPVDLTVGDFDSDGYLDIAYCDSAASAGIVGILLNSSGAGFGTEQTIDTDEEPTKLVAADFNADGYVDIVTLDGGDDQITWYMGNNDGTLEDGVSVATTDNTLTPLDLVVSDVDGDGNPDVIVATTVQMMLFTSDGEGDFTAADFGDPLSSETFAGLAMYGNDLYATVTNSTDERIVQFMNDEGDLTLASAFTIGAKTLSAKGFAAAGQNMFVLNTAGQVINLSFAGGSFPQLSLPSNGYASGSVVAANSAAGVVTMNDLVTYLVPNADGVGNVSDNGDGTFDIGTIFNVTSNADVFALATADFDNDGDTDAVCVYSGNVRLLQNYGTGFSLGNTYTMTSPDVLALAQVGDGYNYVIGTGDTSSTTVSLRVQATADSFGAATTKTFGSNSIDIKVADVDGDGYDDFVVLNDDVQYILGDGSGTYGSVTTLQSVTGTGVKIMGMPVRRTYPDLVVLTQDSIEYSLATDYETFDDALEIELDDYGTNVDGKVGDIDQDGIPDLVVVSNDSGVGTLSVLLGSGNLMDFLPAVSLPTGAAPVGVTLADVDADGKLDIIVTLAAGQVVVHKNGSWAAYY